MALDRGGGGGGGGGLPPAWPFAATPRNAIAAKPAKTLRMKLGSDVLIYVSPPDLWMRRARERLCSIRCEKRWNNVQSEERFSLSADCFPPPTGERILEGAKEA